MVSPETTEMVFATYHKGKKINVNTKPTYVVLDLGCTSSMGSRKAIDALARVAPQHGIGMTYWPCQTTFVFADSQKGGVTETCVLTFPTEPPCTTQIDILEQGEVPILFSLQQMKNLGIELKLRPQGDTITCPAFGLENSPPEVSIAGHLLLDLAKIKRRPAGKR